MMPLSFRPLRGAQPSVGTDENLERVPLAFQAPNCCEAGGTYGDHRLARGEGRLREEHEGG